MADSKLVLCMKWGTLYGPEYVNCLYGMIARNLTGPFRLVCFTDDPSGIRRTVECLPLPELGCDVPPGAPGKWLKQTLWAEDLCGLEGVALFIDLDSVIVDSIDPYFDYGDPDDVITARNWAKPLKRMAQTSVFRFKIGAHGYMLDNLRRNPQLMARYKYEQNYVSSCLRGGVTFWPGAWTKHFGIHCMGPWPLRYLRRPVKPKGVRIVTFPGKPKPPMAAVGKWAQGDAFRSALEHFKACLFGSETHRRRNSLKRFVLPTPWVAENWRP